jgi:hypothetical protein
MMLPRHYRRVLLAAIVAASADERGRCDEWIMHGLKRARQQAKLAGHTDDEIDDWTMEGCLKGRRQAHE